MRGKVRNQLKSSASSGITPAYAGKSVWLHWGSGIGEDHPRLCGEKSIEGQRRVCAEGSPPPMRGKVSPPDFRNFIAGITPAYAGKRCSWEYRD